MNFQVKTLETFNPFESLNHEQANTEQILDFRVIDFKLLCSSVKPAKTKTYERKDFDLFYADDFFVKNYNTIVQKFLIEIYPKTQSVGGKIKCRKRKIKCRIFATNYLSFNLKLKL